MVNKVDYSFDEETNSGVDWRELRMTNTVKQELEQHLTKLRLAVTSKKFHEAEELFKEIESVKVQIKHLESK